MLSIIIPSKTEKYFKRTIEEVLKKATGEIEVIACTDGYEETDKVDGVRYIALPPSDSNQMKQAIMKAVEKANGEYILKLDAHCLLDKGFDEILIRCHQPNWVQIPRRLRLDAEKWEIQKDDRPPVDYQYYMWRDILKGEFHAYRWDSRTIERENILIDDVLDFQGSCYFMRKDYFQKLNLFDIETYGGFGQESTEITMKVLLDGGSIKVNKNTWYAHLHKGKKYGRMYRLNWDEVYESNKKSYKLFAKDHRGQFIQLIKRFMPIPNWPSNWEQKI